MEWLSKLMNDFDRLPMATQAFLIYGAMALASIACAIWIIRYTEPKED